MNARTKTLFAEPNFAKDRNNRAFDIADTVADLGLGHEGTAYMRCTSVTPSSETYHLEGLRIDDEDTNITTWHNREDAIKLVGANVVEQIETDHGRQPDDGYDWAADHRLTFADVV